MYRIKAYFKDHNITRVFEDLYDAIDYRDVVDANYPLKVTFEKGVYPVRTFIYNSWNGIMNANMNPLKNIPDTNVRHMVLIVITVATFELAKSKPSFFLDKKYHTPSRSRSIWVNGKRVDLPAHDKGGEHE
jgi:hypothetical protein